MFVRAAQAARRKQIFIRSKKIVSVRLNSSSYPFKTIVNRYILPRKRACTKAISRATAYASNTNISALEKCLLTKILRIFQHGCLKLLVRPWKENQTTILGNYSHEPPLHIDDSVIEINGFLNIPGVHIDDKLSLRSPINYFKDGLCQGWSSEAT